MGASDYIVYKGKQVKVWRLAGTSGIYSDAHRRVYIQRWEEEGEPAKTPFQRAKKRWKPGERKFSRFDEGITSAGRGLRLAQRGAYKIYIPRYEEIKEIIEEELREKIITKDFFRWEDLENDFKEKILQVGFVLGRALKVESQEGYSQISFLILDADGRINVGAALARTTALSDRLRERLQAIYAWLAVFSGREQGLAIIDMRFRQLSKELETQLKLWMRHSALTRGRTTALQQKVLSDKVSIVSSQLRPFTELRPFDRWASFTISDLEAASKAIKDSSLLLARAILERVKVAFDVKKRQWVLDNFLYNIQANGLDNGRRVLCLQKLLAIQSDFLKLAAAEARVGFIEPVCQMVADCLGRSAIMLKDSHSGLSKVLKPIKEAYMLL